MHNKSPSMNVAFLNEPKVSFSSEASAKFNQLISTLDCEIERHIQVEGFEVLQIRDQKSPK